LLKKFILPEIVFALNVHVVNSTHKIYSLVEVRKHKNEYTIKNTIEDTADISEIKKCITPKSTFVLAITGKGILNRITDQKNNALNTLIPGFNPDEFIVQYSHINDQQNVISAAKKKWIEEIVSEVQSHLSVTAHFVSIGVVALSEVFSLISQQQPEQKFLFRDLEIIVENHKLEKINNSVSEKGYSSVNIENRQVSAACLPAYTAAMHFLQMLTSKITVNQPETTLTYYNNWKTGKQLKVYAVTVIAIWLMILLTNFTLNSYLTEKNQALEERYHNSYKYLSQIDSMETQIKEAEDFIKYLGIDKPSRFTFYADKIAAILPVDITLGNMQINPLDTKNSGSELLFLQDKIYISGTCHKVMSLNTWINAMNKLDWVKDISLKNYSKSEDKGNGVFEMIITLN
jgi:hypothetical protein